MPYGFKSIDPCFLKRSCIRNKNITVILSIAKNLVMGKESFRRRSESSPAPLKNKSPFPSIVLKGSGTQGDRFNKIPVVRCTKKLPI